MKLLYPFAKRFIAGHDFDSAKPKIEQLMDDGYEVSIDYLGELSKTYDDCVRAREQYLQIIDFYKNKKGQRNSFYNFIESSFLYFYVFYF